MNYDVDEELKSQVDPQQFGRDDQAGDPGGFLQSRLDRLQQPAAPSRLSSALLDGDAGASQRKSLGLLLDDDDGGGVGGNAGNVGNLANPGGPARLEDVLVGDERTALESKVSRWRNLAEVGRGVEGRFNPKRREGEGRYAAAGLQGVGNLATKGATGEAASAVTTLDPMLKTASMPVKMALEGGVKGLGGMVAAIGDAGRRKADPKGLVEHQRMIDLAQMHTFGKTNTGQTYDEQIRTTLPEGEERRALTGPQQVAERGRRFERDDAAKEAFNGPKERTVGRAAETGLWRATGGVLPALWKKVSGAPRKLGSVVTHKLPKLGRTIWGGLKKLFTTKGRGDRAMAGRANEELERLRAVAAPPPVAAPGRRRLPPEANADADGFEMVERPDIAPEADADAEGFEKVSAADAQGAPRRLQMHTPNNGARWWQNTDAAVASQVARARKATGRDAGLSWDEYMHLGRGADAKVPKEMTFDSERYTQGRGLRQEFRHLEQAATMKGAAYQGAMAEYERNEGAFAKFQTQRSNEQQRANVAGDPGPVGDDSVASVINPRSDMPLQEGEEPKEEVKEDPAERESQADLREYGNQPGLSKIAGDVPQDDYARLIQQAEALRTKKFDYYGQHPSEWQQPAKPTAGAGLIAEPEADSLDPARRQEPQNLPKVTSAGMTAADAFKTLHDKAVSPLQQTASYGATALKQSADVFGSYLPKAMNAVGWDAATEALAPAQQGAQEFSEGVAGVSTAMRDYRVAYYPSAFQAVSDVTSAVTKSKHRNDDPLAAGQHERRAVEDLQKYAGMQRDLYDEKKRLGATDEDLGRARGRQLRTEGRLARANNKLVKALSAAGVTSANEYTKREADFIREAERGQVPQYAPTEAQGSRLASLLEGAWSKRRRRPPAPPKPDAAPQSGDVSSAPVDQQPPGKQDEPARQEDVQQLIEEELKVEE